MKKFAVICLLALLAFSVVEIAGLYEPYAHAVTLDSTTTGAGGGTDGAPWEKAIQAIAKSVKGPVMFAIGILMFAAAVWGVIRGAELSSWVAPMAIMGLAVAAAANADTVLKFIGVTGCMYL